MKILKIACEQFAGIKDFKIELKDGINVVFGLNESGKSSLVNILTETLFKTPKLAKNNNLDKNFIEAFFPCASRNETSDLARGNFIDGSVTFETDGGIFTLSKKWRSDGQRCEISLIQPNGDKLDNENDIKNLLRAELKQDDEIFREILLSQQTVNVESLRKLIQNNNELKSSGEIISNLTRIYAETGNGISIDELEKKINEKINKLGSNWDNNRNIITDKRFKSDISEAFRVLEETKKLQSEVKILDDEFKNCDKNFKSADEAALTAQTKLDEFRNCEVQLEQNQRLNEKINYLNKDLKEYNLAVQEWPKLEEALKKAVRLSRDLNQVKLMSLMRRDRDLQMQINKLNKELEGMPSPEQIERDINTAETAYDIITNCIDKLKGVNLKLEARVNGNYKFGVVMPSRDNAVLTPDNINNINNNNIFEYNNIDRAVIIKIPEVAEINISKAGVNTDEAKAEWERNKKIIREIIARYNIDLGQDPKNRSMPLLRKKLKDIERSYDIKLREKQRLEYEKNNLNINEKINENIKNINNMQNADDAELIQDDDIRPYGFGAKLDEAAVINDIKQLCTSPDDLKTFIFSHRYKIKEYKEKYVSHDDLKNKINDINKELEEALKELNVIRPQLAGVPDEYKTGRTKFIREGLENNLKIRREVRERALNELNNARHKLESSESSSELEARRIQAEREFNNKKIELAHWVNILNIFNKTKAEIDKNPVDYLIEKFSQYLEVISGGRLESVNNNLNSALKPEIYSRGRRLGWLNISEGTKDTIALAFRLAVTDQLYKDGGAVVVFDDPLVNMDAERAGQACDIIKKFADKNQVIFLTCRHDYDNILSGNFIELKN